MSKKQSPETNTTIQSQHEKIKQGGQIEEFAEAMAQFCKVEGWKKLNDEEGNPFKSLRHYIEASPPFGAGYPGKSGLERIEAYLSLTPVIKNYFQHCHANCLFEMAKDEGVTPTAVAKREWNDSKGARLAKAIQDNPEEIYLEKAAPYIEGREPTKPPPRKKTIEKCASLRVNITEQQPYVLAKRIIETFNDDFIKTLIDALGNENIDDFVDLESRYNLAALAFKQSKTDDGWGINNITSPPQLKDREPLLEFSTFNDDENKDNRILSLRDKNGLIADVKFKGNKIDILSFPD